MFHTNYKSKTKWYKTCIWVCTDSNKQYTFLETATALDSLSATGHFTGEKYLAARLFESLPYASFTKRLVIEAQTKA